MFKKNKITLYLSIIFIKEDFLNNTISILKVFDSDLYFKMLRKEEPNTTDCPRSTQCCAVIVLVSTVHCSGCYLCVSVRLHIEMKVTFIHCLF